jgi:hypothetical protein
MNEAVLEKGLLGALRLPKEGRIYDLDPGRFPGMPQWSGHPTFQIVSYRTPKGLRIGGDQAWLGPEHNAPNIAFMSELIITGCHIGAHIDALAHITCGPDDHWYGGDSANTALGDFGPTTHDASTIPPMLLVRSASNGSRSRIRSASMNSSAPSTNSRSRFDPAMSC